MRPPVSQYAALVCSALLMLALIAFTVYALRHGIYGGLRP